MNKPIIVTAVVLALGAGGYVATANHIGNVVRSEVQHFETSLAQMDEVRVYRLTYEHGLFSGTLRYDLAITPMGADPVHELLKDMLGSGEDASLRLDGEIAVSHGPWIGGGKGFGLAHLSGGIALPDALREHLPQYPGQRPMLEADGLFGFDRKIALSLRGIDYRGKLVDPASGTSGDLNFAGLNGRFGFDSSASWLNGTLRLDELSLNLTAPENARASIAGIDITLDLARSPEGFWTGPSSLSIREADLAADEVKAGLGQLTLRSTSQSRAGRDGGPRLAVQASGGIARTQIEASREGKQARFIADGLSLEFDALREWQAIWLGKASLRLASLEGGDGNADIRLSALALSSDASLSGALVDQVIRYESGPIRINGAELGGGTMEFALKGLRGDVLNELAQALEKYKDDAVPVFDAEFQALLRDAIQRMLAETVSLNLDPIGLNIEVANDLAAHLRTTLNGSPDIDLDDVEALVNRLDIQAGFKARTSALKALTRIATHAEQARSAASGQAPDPQAVALESEMRFQMMMLAARQAPFLIVSDDEIRAEAAFRNGRLAINGQDVGGIGELGMLGALAGGLFGGDAGGSDGANDDTGSASSSGGAPIFDTDPLYETVSLSANFEPDPYEIEVVAGGSHEIDSSLGEDCYGYINRDQPDVVLEYDSGAFSLYLYAESEADTALAVRAPDGSWHCNDDAPGRGLDPTVSFDSPRSGAYQIWVGTVYSEAAEATLFISELDPAGQ